MPAETLEQRIERTKRETQARMRVVTNTPTASSSRVRAQSKPYYPAPNPRPESERRRRDDDDTPAVVIWPSAEQWRGWAREPEPEPVRPGQGLFDGGGASGDWDDKPSAPSESCTRDNADSYSVPDTGSTCDVSPPSD